MSATEVLSTERLLLRQSRPEDLPVMAAINRDRAGHRYDRVDEQRISGDVVAVRGVAKQDLSMSSCSRRFSDFSRFIPAVRRW
jgi:hypothetical protein